MSQNEISKKLKQLKELESLIDEAQAEAEGLRDEIKAFMGESFELRAGEYKVSFKPVTVSRFDSTAFKATHAELYSQYTKQTTVRRFCLS